MLPNHAPLLIAEQFGTLATLHGDRIDLGLGRAPGGDQAVYNALRRTGSDDFPADVDELMTLLGDPQPQTAVRAFPGEGTNVPIWILGSSLYGAQLAAYFGLPYAFASHFAPAALEEAAKIYRRDFKPSTKLAEPYFMLAANVFAADTDEEGAYLRTSMQIAFARMQTGTRGKLPYPVKDIDAEIGERMRRSVEPMLRVSATGSPETVRKHLKSLVEIYEPEELIMTGQIHEHAARVKSFEIAANAMEQIIAA
jgi:luciferase family oxidoreductase group 1